MFISDATYGDGTDIRYLIQKMALGVNSSIGSLNSSSRICTRYNFLSRVLLDSIVDPFPVPVRLKWRHESVLVPLFTEIKEKLDN